MKLCFDSNEEEAKRRPDEPGNRHQAKVKLNRVRLAKRTRRLRAFRPDAMGWSSAVTSRSMNLVAMDHVPVQLELEARALRHLDDPVLDRGGW